MFVKTGCGDGKVVVILLNSGNQTQLLYLR